MKRLYPCLLLCCLLAPAVATAAAPPPASAMPAAAATFTAGSLRVWRYGRSGRAIILVPGLASGPWAWRGTIEHFAGGHVIYAVTLAGADGVPAPQRQSGLMDLADASLLKLIRSRHIDRPVLIGHSLGGTLAIRFAAEHPGLLSGVVAVDGLPVFPLLSASQREAAAQQMRGQIGHITPGEFRMQQLQYMQAIGVVDPDRARRYAELSALSDPDATLEYAAEDLETDLRPQLKKITMPLLEISPYYKPDYQRYAELNKRPLTSAGQKADYYRQLLKGAPHATVVTIAGARHYVMLDQPQAFYSALGTFLSGLSTH